jgi:dephospho-CoA kinase
MFVLGVTGGTGAGKSSVARLLEERGARVLDADRIVRELYRGGDLARRIEARFGPGVTTADGSVDRAALGRIVFAAADERKALEAMVHPAVRERVMSSLASWREEGFEGLVVIDAALLVEALAPYPLDALLVVTAPEEVRIARLEAQGVTPARARERMSAQFSDAEKLRRADYRIENDGSPEELEEAVARLLRQLGRDEEGQSG